MKSFFKYVFATVVGIIISSLVLFFLSIGFISILVSSQEKTVDVKPNSILFLELNQQIVDRKPNMPFDFSTFSKTNKIGLNNLLKCIEKAKSDPNIEGIYMELTYIPAGVGTINEIRNALLDFRESGKFVSVYSETLAQGAYYLASAADNIYFYPIGFFEWVGLRIQSPFFKNALEKYDVQATIIKHGKFKSAGENFAEKEFSPENSEQLHRVLSTFWNEILKNVESERNIPAARLNEMADKLLVIGPQAAYEFGLVDSLLYKDQVIEILKVKAGIEAKKDLRFVSLGEYSDVPEYKEYKGLAKDKIAVIYASGTITGGEGEDQTIGSDKFARTIRKARKDSTIKAIVLRINSPGGSAIASDVIWRELQLARMDKPIVVSMGDVAASGGYYMACIADSIFAQPTTLTGSIGVIGMHLNFQGLLNRYGVTFDSEKTNPYADFLSGVRPASPYELNYWQNLVDTFYTTFVRRVDEGRQLTFDEIDALGQGRIWSGTDALENGLIDKLGGLQDAVTTAKNMAGLSDKYRVVELPKQEDPIEKLIHDLTQASFFESLERKLGINNGSFSTLELILENQGILARMPYDITIQ